MTTGKKDLPRHGKPGFDALPLARFIEKDVQCARQGTSAYDLASMMMEGSFGAIPIVDDKHRLVGIVSEYDLLASLERGEKWSERSAQDVMSPNPYSVLPDMTVGTLIHVFLKSNLIRVPVVDAQGALIGIIARRDVLRDYLNYNIETPKW